ncbi:MAG: hypothetical protein C4521_01830 [Actinobacteria bacterium]|nr:MAG: hypothetical protein C4521_01830 [Actinomycetota bacterium]
MDTALLFVAVNAVLMLLFGLAVSRDDGKALPYRHGDGGRYCYKPPVFIKLNNRYIPYDTGE